MVYAVVPCALLRGGCELRGVISMKDVEALTASLSFDDLLGAVTESSRGRWFLDEYQKRLRKAENGDILSAINRIETRIAEISGGVGSGEVMRMKAALNSARSDIAKLAPAKGLSDEGRLFASLAELARKTLPAEKATADIAPGIIKALQLVDELDTTLNAPVRGEHYFKQDQNVFEPVTPTPKPVLVASTPEPLAPAPTPVEAKKPEVEVPPQGAKLVIIKAGVKPEETNVAAVEPVKAEPAAIAESKKPDTGLHVEKIDNPRIVIIRRKPEEMTEVPLADEVKTETAA
jgi:hypothetical protein